MLHNRSSGFWIAISLMGMMTGTVLGEAIAAVLPESSTALRSFFGGSLEFSIGPFALNLVVFRFALEQIALKLNLMSFAGLMFVGYLYRWF